MNMITCIQILSSCIIIYWMRITTPCILISNPCAHLRRCSWHCNYIWVFNTIHVINTCSSFEVILYDKLFFAVSHQRNFVTIIFKGYISNRNWCIFIRTLDCLKKIWDFSANNFNVWCLYSGRTFFLWRCNGSAIHIDSSAPNTRP